MLIKLCEVIAHHHRQSALIVGLPIGFSHAPAAKRQLMELNIPYLAVKGTSGGGLLAAVALNRIAVSLSGKPDLQGATDE